MATSGTCPICGKPTVTAHKPFCSRGCVDRDLLQWLGEGYRLPAGPATDEEASKDDAAGLGTGLDSADNDD
ncbi:DNA gyrase inhibitor YacG [Sphingomonas sp. 28-62-11]|uniref:DNA gyrase inhibitor YacG n=1 Tax=Sphingomonas sp. 28-62-11 TaxID=1970432 RepID=UPI000BCA3461|nr:MAG: hypothetical protein B7Y49_06795 [Sphingomonas sp. 28-62-11]